MSDKWYNDPNCDWFYEEKEQEYKRKKILRRRIGSACRVAVVVSILSMIGIVGSAELGTISIGQFIAYELIAVAVLITSIRIGATME